jgi:hypothetical protein
MDRRLIRGGFAMVALVLLVFGGSLISILGLTTTVGWILLILGFLCTVGVAVDWAFTDSDLPISARSNGRLTQSAYPSEQAIPAPPPFVLRRFSSAIYRFTVYPPPAPFFGRKKELARLEKILRSKSTVVVISGDPGSGRKSLARAVAERLTDRFPHAMLELNLQTPEGPLGVEEAQRRLLLPFYTDQKLPENADELGALYARTFHKNQALVLLDNANGLEQIQRLLPPAPSAAIITTINAKPFLQEKFTVLRLGGLSKKDAAAMLLQYCSRLRNSPANHLYRLVQDINGLPLALRIAAGFFEYHPDWGVEGLRQRWPNQRTIRSDLNNGQRLYGAEIALLMAYYDLDDLLKERFRGLGILPAPFPVEAIQAIWGTSSHETQLFYEELQGRGLIDSIPRLKLLVLHEQTQAFAMEHLKKDTRELNLATERHAYFYLNRGGTTELLYSAGGEKMAAGLASFERDWPHFQTAFTNMTATEGLRPAPDSAPLWLANLPEMLPNFLRLYFSRPQDRKEILERSVNASHVTNNRKLLGAALFALGQVYSELGDQTMAIGYVEQSLAVHRDMHDHQGELAAINFLANAYASLGRSDKAQQFARERRTLMQPA